MCQEHGDRVRLCPPFIPPWELEWQPHTGREVAPWQVPLGARAALQRPLGCLRAEGGDGRLHLLLPDVWPLPSGSRGCFCRCVWWPRPRIVRREGVCGSGDVTYVQDLTHVGRKGAGPGPQKPRCQR